MNCTYCGIGLHAGQARCAGCGAPSAMPLAEPAGTAASIYEQIGRAVVDREPNDVLDRIVHFGERKDASSREQKITHAAKILVALFILWHFPFILIPIFGLGMMFFLWVYLPYRGMKAVLQWFT